MTDHPKHVDIVAELQLCVPIRVTSCGKCIVVKVSYSHKALSKKCSMSAHEAILGNGDNPDEIGTNLTRRLQKLQHKSPPPHCGRPLV